MKKVELKPKEQRIAQAHLKGAKLKEIASVEYPNATEHSGEVLVSRQLQKPRVAKYVEQEKTIALKKYNFTWDRIIAKLNDKFDATKNDFHTGAQIDDNPTQLQAMKTVIDLLRDKNIDEDAKEQIFTNLPSNIDEVQLIRLMKK